MLEINKERTTKFIRDLADTYDDHPLAKHMISFIPGGQIIDCLISEFANKIKKERFEDLIDKIRNLNADIEKIKQDKVNTEELYDIIYTIVNKSIETRLTELRQIYAAIFVDVVDGNDKVYNIESLIEKVSNIKEKDLTFIKHINSFVNNNQNRETIFPNSSSLNGENLFKFINSEDFDMFECIWYLNRFVTLGLLQTDTRQLTKNELLPYEPTKYFYKITKYLES